MAEHAPYPPAFSQVQILAHGNHLLAAREADGIAGDTRKELEKSSLTLVFLFLYVSIVFRLFPDTSSLAC